MAWNVKAGPYKESMKLCEDELVLGISSPNWSPSSQEVVGSTTGRGTENRQHQYMQAIGPFEAEDDDSVEDQSHPAAKKRRLTVEQVKFLEMSFEIENKLDPERKALIANRLGLLPRQVAIWFQNRRARWKNKRLEQEYATLKAKYDTVVKDKESLVKEAEALLQENKKLQTEVARLMGVLERSGSEEGLGGGGGVGSPTKSEGKSEVEDGSNAIARDIAAEGSNAMELIEEEEEEAEAAANMFVWPLKLDEVEDHCEFSSVVDHEHHLLLHHHHHHPWLFQQPSDHYHSPSSSSWSTQY